MAWTKPADYATRTKRIIVDKWPAWKFKTVNERVNELTRLIPELDGIATDDPTAAEVEAVIKRLERAAEAERRRLSPIMQWTYDFCRHTALTRTLQFERELLAELEAKISKRA
jgi:hypothetical protein